MKTIHKYKIKPDPSFIELPVGAKILHVDKQEVLEPNVYLWAEVDTCAATEKRCFFLAGTGHKLPDCSDTHSCNHLGTVLFPALGHVLHAYEWGAACASFAS